ncbi:BCCT family transporter, partial [Staphylococcus capitis]|uniref:BCCT family transporter n=1 Tax=Staphylococcus capitis TaxID=29388 RepID=UPI0021B2B4C7
MSNINIPLPFLLLLPLFILRPTLYIFNTFTNPLANYIPNFFKITFTIPSPPHKFKSLQQSTIFYSPSSISSPPFLPIFIPPLSTRRTIKQFILRVLFLPALVSFLFFPL